MGEADDLALGRHSIVAVPCDDTRPHPARPSFGEAFTDALEKRSTCVQLGLSLRPACDDGFPIDCDSGQPLKVRNRVERA
jgi:hypothetical protein